MAQPPSPRERPSEIVVVDGRVYHLGLRPGELAENLFVVGDPARAYTVASRFDRVDHEVKHREFVTLTGSHRGLPVSVMGTGMGPDNVEIALVEAWALVTLDLATRLRRPETGPGSVRPLTVLRIGTSGGTREDVAVGTLVISSYAIGLDSTGLYYDSPAADETVTALEHATRRAIDEGVGPGSRFAGAFFPYASRATPALVAALERQAAAAGARFVTGATVTAPGFFGPSGRHLDGVSNTVHDVKARLGRIEAHGVAVFNMEMESSLLFHLAALLGIRAGTICPTISNPAGHAAVLDPTPFVAQAIEIALAAMHDVSLGSASR
jgi:uridine phosphorylase